MTTRIKIINNCVIEGYEEVSDYVYGKQFNEALVHQIVTAYRAGGRQGTKMQKTRAEVSGGGIKPWKQKGSGRARAGTTRSPLWRTGGVTFASENRSYNQKINKKMYKGAMKCILSQLIVEDRISISNDLDKEFQKTKELVEFLKYFKARKVLIVTDAKRDSLVRVGKNISNLNIKTSTSLDPVSLISADQVIFVNSAVKLIEQRLL